MEGASYHALTPTDSAEQVEEYLEALTWALQQKDIHNIALAGAYGSGKSSIIETFLRNERERKHIIFDHLCSKNRIMSDVSMKISMAEFEIWKEDAGKQEKTRRHDDSSQTLNEVSEWILKQIFYKVESNEIPQSRYHKLCRRAFWSDYTSVALALFLIVSLIFLFVPFTLDRMLALVDWIALQGAFSTVMGALTLCLFVALVLAGAVYKWRFLFSNLKLKVLKLPAGTGIESERESETVFNRHLDEIVYFFEVTKYRVVFFEDLDRLDEPNLFVRLRELNTLLNNSDAISKKPVVFVYAVRDDLFGKEDRTKFFDFIIPVIPIINTTNSREALLEWLRKEQEKDKCGHNISEQFMRDVSPYIADMRILRNICNEFLIYKGTLKKSRNTALADHKIFAMILFKNLYPQDFAHIQGEQGIIKEVFAGKPLYRNRKETELRQWLDSQRNYASEKEVLSKEKELRDLLHAPLRTMIDEYNIGLVREKAKNNGLLVFLVRRGYIDETYADYINYFKGESYPESDRDFIRAVREQREVEFFYEIHKPLAVIQDLSVEEFGQQEIYNRDLVDALLAQDGEEEKKEALYTRLKFSDKRSWEFLCFYVESGKQSGRLIEALAMRWTNIWVSIEDYRWIFENQQDLFLARILENVPKKRIGELNVSGLLTNVFERNANILQRLKGVRADCICEALDILSVQFHHLDIDGVSKVILDDIFTKNRYVLNVDMVQNVIVHVAPLLAKDFPAKSYTVVRKAEYAPLVDRVHDNLIFYVKEVMLQQERLADDEADVLALLDQLIEEVDLCRRLIDKETFRVSKLRDCCYVHLQNYEEDVRRIWDTILSTKKLAATWENIYAYWSQFHITQELRIFIEACGDSLRESGTECLDDAFIRAFVNGGFDMSILRILLPLVREEHINANTVTEDFLERIFFAPESRPTLRGELLQKYGEKYMTERLAKSLCRLQLPITKDVFFAAWRYLDNSERVNLAAVYADILQGDDFEACFSDMGQPYHDFVPRTRHKVRIPKTDTNEKIVKRLEDIDYITSLTEEAIVSTKQDRGEETALVCWVKAVP